MTFVHVALAWETSKVGLTSATLYYSWTARIPMMLSIMSCKVLRSSVYGQALCVQGWVSFSIGSWLIIRMLHRCCLCVHSGIPFKGHCCAGDLASGTSFGAGWGEGRGARLPSRPLSSDTNPLSFATCEFFFTEVGFLSNGAVCQGIPASLYFYKNNNKISLVGKVHSVNPLN